MPPQPDRRTALAILALLLLAYGWFHQGGGWNQNVRFAQLQAVVERATFAIDDHLLTTLAAGDDGVTRYERLPLSSDSTRSARLPHAVSLDVSEHAGHVYPNKPPGLLLLALPGHVVARSATHALGLDPAGWWTLTLQLYLTTLLSVGLLAAAGGAAFHDVARRLFPQASPGSHLAATLTYALGTPIFAYATFLIDPAVVASLSLFGFRALLIARERSGAPRLRQLFAAGIWVGLAVMVNQSAALIAAALLAYAVAVLRPRAGAAAFAAGGIGPALALAAYQWICFGSPFDLPQDHQLDMFRTPAPLLGIFGVPRARPLLELLVLPYRGLLFWSPVLGMGLAGLIAMFATRRHRPEAWLFAASFLAFWLMNASFNAWHGGGTFGPRYLVPVVPFLALPLVTAFERARIAAGALAAGSIALSLLVTAVDPQVEADVRRPLTDFYLPLARGGSFERHGLVLHGPVSAHPIGIVGEGLETLSSRSEVARWSSFNVGEFLRPESLASLAPLALLLAGAGALARWRRLAALAALAWIAGPVLAPAPARADVADPLLAQGELLLRQVYDVGRWTLRVPTRLALPVLVRLKLHGYVGELPLAPEVRDRVLARIDSEGFVDEVVPFLAALKETYVATPEAAANDFDAHLRRTFSPADPIEGFEHSMFRWQVASAPKPGGGLSLDPAIAAQVVTLYDALFLADADPDAALAEELRCAKPLSDAETQAKVARAMPILRDLLADVKDDLAPEGDMAAGIRSLLEDDARLSAVTVSALDFATQQICKHYRVFALRIFREEQLRTWLESELDAPGGGRLFDFLRYAEVRPRAVHVVVDGLQGHLIEALARGRADDPFLREILREQQAASATRPAGVPSAPAPPQSVRFLERLARTGFRHPAYLPYFRHLYAAEARGIARAGIATTPTISVRNLPIAKTGAPVAGPGGTGIPNFHFVERGYARDGRVQGRAYYFYGNDAVLLDALAQASGMRTLFERLPRLSSFSCAAQYDAAAHYTVDAFLNLGIGEKVRDFGERLCLQELARRAGNEERLRELRRELLASQPALTASPEWYEWWDRLGAGSERAIARKLVEEIAALEQDALPDYLLYYNPWPDHFAHFEGPFSDEIVSPSGELNRLDYWLGRIRNAYTTAGVLPRTLFAMAGDHGLAPVFHLLNPEVVVFDGLRADGIDFRVVKISSDEGEGPKLTDRLHPPSMKGIDVVVASTAGGNYMLDLFADQGAGFTRQPVYSELRAVRPLAAPAAAPAVDLVHELATRLGGTLDYLAVREAGCGPDRASLRLVAMRGADRVDAHIERAGDRIHYAPGRIDLLETDRLTPYETLGPAERDEHAALRRRCVEAAQPDDPATWCSEVDWRRLTSATPRPDSVVQLAHLYDTDRAGTVNLFPGPGIAYNSKVPGRHAGEHFHEKDAFVGAWGTPVAAAAEGPRLRSAVNGSVAQLVYEYLAGERTGPGVDGFGYPSLAEELLGRRPSPRSVRQAEGHSTVTNSSPSPHDSSP